MPDRSGGDSSFTKLQQAVAGQFSIERELGRGGGGIVYLAHEIRLDRPVVIKLLRAEAARDPTARERFLREARTAAKLAHPNIVSIYRAEEVEGYVFFTMAYVDGESLGRRVRRSGPLDPLEAAAVIQDVAWALAYAHASGVVHRDIKPDNILLDRTTGRALVTDFGIAYHVQDGGAGPSDGVVAGTAQFMSPEQASGKAVDARSDIYSLGIVAWYALTGRHLFDGSPETVLRKHVLERPPSLLTIAPAVPVRLAEAIDRALAKRPDSRYADAEAFAQAVALATARHIEMSAPLHVWLLGGDEVRYVAAMALGAAGLTIARGHFWLELAVFTLAAVGAYCALELLEVRRLLAAGYQLEDLRRTLRGHVTSQGREHGVRAAMKSSAAGYQPAVVRALGIGVIAFAALVLAEGAAVHHRLSPDAAALVIAGVAVTATAMYRPPDRDHVAAFRAGLWESPAGTLLIQLASWHLPERRDPTLVAARSAEATLRRATQDLYETLPPAVQEKLRLLPDTVAHLQQDAGVLRHRIEGLGRALALVESDPDSVESKNAAGRRLALAEIRAQRDAADQRLGDVLAELESIRVGLLHVQATADDLRALTTRLAAVNSLDASTDPRP